AHARPYTEADEPRPDDLYGVLKETAEHMWTALAGGTALRLANVYGAGAGVDVGLDGAVERFARAAARGETLRILGSGQQRIDYVHITDVVGAFRRALASPGPLPPAINIGGGAPIAIADLAARCVRAGEALGARPRLEREPTPAGKPWPDRSLVIELAARVLDWRS